MEKDRKFRALAIAAICVAIVGVSVAYAALTASLTITGTATVAVTDAWKLQWTAVTVPTKSNAVTVTTAPVIGAGNQDITWAASFAAPQTEMTFTATYTNGGTIPAKLEAPAVNGSYIAATGEASANFDYTIKIGADSIDTKTGYILEAGKSVTLTITVKFDKDASLSNEQLTALDTKTAVFTLGLPFTQATDAEVAAGTKF